MDRGDWVLLITGGAAILIFMGASFWAINKDDQYKNACYSAGGIPIHGYCVKPDSFIEVK